MCRVVGCEDIGELHRPKWDTFEREDAAGFQVSENPFHPAVSFSRAGTLRKLSHQESNAYHPFGMFWGAINSLALRDLCRSSGIGKVFDITGRSTEARKIFTHGFHRLPGGPRQFPGGLPGPPQGRSFLLPSRRRGRWC